MDTTGIKRIDELELSGKRVLMRCDFNVPLDADQTITDDTRIRAAMRTIGAALERGAKLILCSHLGRPKGERDAKLSLLPVGDRLRELLGYEVIMPDDIDDSHVDTLVDNLQEERQVILLENLRFHPGETKNDPEFAKRLASLADVYIDDAFGAVHRAHASTYGVVRHFSDRSGSKGMGYLIDTELKQLGAILDRPARPFAAVLGGAKVSDKLAVLQTFLERANTLMIGGAMAYTFLKARGVEVGDSLVDEDLLATAAELLDRAAGARARIMLPLDHVVAPSFDAPSGTVSDGAAIPHGMIGLDIGPKTRAAYAAALAEARTIFWNGPMGVFERDAFAAGTLAVAHAVASSPATSLVGGGDSAAAVKKAGLTDRIDHVSTGGGASIEYLEGRPLPGIEALRSNHPFA